MPITEQDIENIVYRKRTIGKTKSNPRAITDSELNECNNIISNLMDYILTKHS